MNDSPKRELPGGIRLAVPADLHSIMAIAARWDSLPRWTRAHFESELDSAKNQFFVFTDGREVLGYGGVFLLPPEAQVTTLAVHPDQARTGVGTVLLRRLQAAAAEAACEVIGLEVGAANRAAIALYEREGYRVVGRRPKYYNDGSDALLMSRRLVG